MSLSQPLRISTLCHPALFFDAPNLQVLKMGFVQCRCLPCLLSEYISRSTAKLGEEKVELGGGKADLGFSCGLPSPRPCLSMGGKRRRRVSRTSGLRLLWVAVRVAGSASAPETVGAGGNPHLVLPTRPCALEHGWARGAFFKFAQCHWVYQQQPRPHSIGVSPPNTPEGSEGQEVWDSWRRCQQTL